MGKKSQLIGLIGAIVFAILSVFIGLYFNKQQMNKISSEEEIVTAGIERTHSSTEENLSNLYFDDEHYFLKEIVNDKLLEDISVSVSNDQENKMFEDIVKRYEILNEFNALFENPVLKEDIFQEEVAYKSTSTEETVLNLMDKVKETNEDDLFYQGIKTYLERHPISTNEDSIVIEAKQALGAIIKDGMVVDGFTIEQYNVAREKINQLPEGTTKSELQVELEKVQTVLQNMGISYLE